MQPLDWNYVAGFFDGEGCVSTHQNRARRGNFGTVVSMSQGGELGKELLGKIRGFLDERGMTAHVGIQRHPKSRPNRIMWALRVCGRADVTLFLKTILPHVRMKKLIVQDTLRFLVAYPPVPKGYVFRELNQRKAKVPLNVLVAEYHAGASVKDLTAKYRYSEVNAIYQRFRRSGVSLQ